MKSQPLNCRLQKEKLNKDAKMGSVDPRGNQEAIPYRGEKLPDVTEDLIVSKAVYDLDCNERLWVPQAKDGS